MANTTTTQVPSTVSAYYDRNLLTRAYPLFLHTRFAQVRDIPRNNTEVIKFRKYGSLTAATTALTEGVTPSGSQLSITDITATVAQYGDFVTLSDFVQITTLDPLLMETSEVLGDQMGDSLDQITRDVLQAGTTIQYAGGAVSRITVAAGMVMNADEVRKAVRTLKGNNAKKIMTQIDPGTGYNSLPVRAAYVAICSHNTEYDLKKDPDFVGVEQYASGVSVLEGEIGKVDEVRILSATSNSKVFSAAGAGSIDVHSMLIFGREAYGITRISGEAVQTITKPLGSAGTNDPLDQRGTMGWKATFVAKILQQAFMIRIEHAVSS